MQQSKKSKRKIIGAIILAAVLLVGIVPFSAMAISMTPKVEEETMISGRESVISLQLDTSIDQVMSLQMKVYFDDTLLQYKENSLKGPEGLSTDGVVQQENPGTVQERSYMLLTFESAAEEGVTLSAGELCNMIFTTKGDLSADTSISSLVTEGQKVDGTAFSTDEMVCQTVILPARFQVTLSEDFLGADSVATGETYTFAAKDKHYSYSFSGSKMGDTDAVISETGNGVYTIANVRGTLMITAQKAPRSYPVACGTDIKGAASATYLTDYTFTVQKETGYEYGLPVVKCGQNEIALREEDGIYTVPGDSILGELSIFVEKKLATELAEGEVRSVTTKQYATMSDGKIMTLVLVEGTPAEGQMFTLDDNRMFYSEQYSAYVSLVISKDKWDGTKARSVLKEGIGTATHLKKTNDINGSGRVDMNDTQLVWNMANRVYREFDEATEEMFLRADVNADGKIDSADVALVSGAVL